MGGGSTIIKGFESNGNDASDIPKRRGFSRISVEGYETSLHAYDLILALTKHFASCGKIIHIYVPRNAENGTIHSYAFMHIAGEGALEKALELSGSDVEEGGWRVYAKESPFQGQYNDPAGAKHLESERQIGVTGYDTSLPKIDVQIGLSKHFSSCGEVTNVSIPTDDSGGLYRFASITILGGQGAVDKALKLSGRNVGGWKITVDMVLPPPDMERGSPSLCLRSAPKRAYKRVATGHGKRVPIIMSSFCS